jgi:hypothetical protein
MHNPTQNFHIPFTVELIFKFMAHAVTTQWKLKSVSDIKWQATGSWYVPLEGCTLLYIFRDVY